MELGWNPYGALGVSVGIVAVVLAVVVYAHSRRSATGLRITFLLVSEGLSVAFATGLGFFMLEPEGAMAARLTGEVLMVAVPAAQLLIIGTLDTPLGRPFRGRKPVIVLGAATLLGAASIFLWPGFWVLGSEPGGLTPHRVMNGPGLGIVMAATMLAATYSLVANIHAWRRATDPSRRQRARAFAVAYGMRDLALLVLGSIWWSNSEMMDVVGYPVTVAAYVPFLAYGFLRGQLFDIQVRVRRAASQSVAVSIVVGAYFLALQGAGAFLSPRFGSGVALGAVAIAAFTVVPLQRGVGRMVASVWRINPDLDARKLAVYRQALADNAAADGALARRSQRMLRRLRDELGLTDRDHAVLLHAILGSRQETTGEYWTAGTILLDAYTLRHPLSSRAWLATDRQGRPYVLKRSRAAAKEEEVLRLRHPNLVRLVASGRAGRDHVLVLEHGGRALSELLEEGAVGPEQWRRIVRDLLAGLGALHAKGIVHGDVKPANVIVDDDGTARLADFDVARVGDVTLGARPDDLPVGTLRYMSPEQARGRPPTVQSDVYAAAATLYEALTGIPWLHVVPGESAQELQRRAAHARPAPHRLPQAPRLVGWFRHALAPHRPQRFASVAEMEAAFAEAAVPPAVRAPLAAAT